MRSFLAALVVGTLVLAAPSAFAQTVRYFAVWSYTENAPHEEISPDRLKDRRLGYWSLEFAADGSVLRGTYHGSSGAVWLSLEYVREGERIYADLYTASGQLVTRKSTQLRDLQPRQRR
jgi:hypothetical protein